MDNSQGNCVANLSCRELIHLCFSQNVPKYMSKREFNRTLMILVVNFFIFRYKISPLHHHTNLAIVSYRPRISDHDLQQKLRKVSEFLVKGHRVTIAVLYKGEQESKMAQEALHYIVRLVEQAHQVSCDAHVLASVSDLGVFCMIPNCCVLHCDFCASEV